MTRLEIATGESLYYEYDAAGARGMTFVFVNARTGNKGMWQGGIAPALRAGTPPAELGNLASAELMKRVTRDAHYRRRMSAFLGGN